ncbi:tRNA dimethylallyltransferase [Kineosphaera limosa]|uniref:tRNA dimethylallyltransferase n=1 Tax=Kineosphaera limosa NBRC 100340 TaxID=1184609 RepID=K6WKJ6_9MICO|nr:tRNA (adenosine(37)-N6)-dimethylallyltransferase MiaA [Kineosphaera limosa]NYE02856.1 tRNA dimethylallyltransferase [Kineosphaera limosa]GAB94286.1 tRNA dimethylallyltransferase [Kineosphaera limosa NBRC 100340]
MTPVLAVVGPTASGKSDLALEIAERIGAQIVGADAFQLYRGMDIGTAKVPMQDRRGIPHHQIDVLDIAAEANIAAYQRHARTDLAAIAASGDPAVLVGGSGLYVRAALDDLQIPPTDPAVRARWEERVRRDGLPAVREHLMRVDPAAAAAIEPSNARRIVRACEVVELTGQPFSATLPTGRFAVPAVLVGLRLPRPVIDERIERRTHAMWEQGLLDEVQALAQRGLAQTPTASRAVGYPQALAQLEGRMSRAEAIAATSAATRRLVRRQESWFRRDRRIHWLDAAESSPAAGAGIRMVPVGELADRAVDRWRAGAGDRPE